MDGLRGGVVGGGGGECCFYSSISEDWAPKHLGQTEREQSTPTQAEAGLAQEREATITFPASRLQTQPYFRRAITVTGDTNGPGSVCL